jgi:exosortase
MKGRPSWVAPAIVALVVLTAYGRVILELANDWRTDPNYAHGFAIPLISGFLIWKRRGEFRGLRPSPSNLALGGVLGALGLLILGAAGAEVYTQRVSLIILVASVAVFLHGYGLLRIISFPLAFLLLAVPIPYVLYYGITAPMQTQAAGIAAWGLQAIGVHAAAIGNTLRLPQGNLEVAEACSGIRSLYAFVGVGAIVAYTTTVPLWARLVIFSMTIPLAILGNAVRVWTSGMGVYLIGPRVTKGLPHELFGIAVFLGCMCIFIGVRKLVRSLWSSAQSLPRSSSGQPASMRERFEPGDRSR